MYKGTNKGAIAVAIFFFTITGIMLLTNGGRERAFQKNARMSVGTITDYYIEAKGSGVIFNYTYTVDTMLYHGEGYLCFRVPPKNARFFLNHQFPLLYSKVSPEIARLLVFPDDFIKNGVEFPDSLKWILNYKW
ncbi:hypothetical protein FHW36_11432 [Chitinophaga polysaccharea]|uniref:Uncharacterized protein n=1 Tax=Chitinophaga polysaccharea TaxID=1293035 RepID=A0A561P3I3_9BACT|nr:hypothetical protein [Chitinophaga polysaccharea]TWF32655.1 hypothetical protein FHW36_11432 [Chitinophaga polysaccharea]